MEGNRLQAIRTRAGVTQAELAERTGIRQAHISRFETGERELSSAQAETVLRIARALGTTVENLIDTQEAT